MIRRPPRFTLTDTLVPYTTLFRSVLEGDFASISALASAAGLPLSTAHRLLTGLQHAGFIVAVSRGRYISGPTLRRLARPENDTNRILVQITAPILAKLS